MNKVRVNITNAVINAPTYAGVTFSPSMINFFYGKNGTGKSTLAKAFTDGSAALTWKGDPYPSERILIYNEDFIEKNVRSYGNIPGVFTISEVNAEKNYVLVKGSVPGPKKSIVMLRTPSRTQFSKPTVKELVNHAPAAEKGE